MQFLVLMTQPDTFERWQAAGDDERAQAFVAFETFAHAVAQQGSIVAGGSLDDPRSARTVQPGEPGRRTTTEGPFAEASAQVGGFFVVDLPDLDTAVELAGLLPGDYTIEVRSVDG